MFHPSIKVEGDICFSLLISTVSPPFPLCLGSQFTFVVSALVSLTNHHLKVIFYWIMIGGGSLLPIPGGPEFQRLITDSVTEKDK